MDALLLRVAHNHMVQICMWVVCMDLHQFTVPWILRVYPMIRRQYHPHQTEHGLFIWDVHRLVELTQDLPVIEKSIDSIQELDERSWFNDEEHPPSCRAIAEHAKLIEEADLDHPIILSAEGRVMDGMHRVCKAWMRGDEHIKAVQFEEDPEPDYIDMPLEELPYEDLLS